MAAVPDLDDPFRALSTELVSHGYLSRPLLLSALISTVPPASSSSSSLKKQQDALLLRARAQDQLTKLLWSLLERNDESRQEVKHAVEREGRAVVEWERERTLNERLEKDHDSIARELEKERAKTKDLENRLRGEVEKHRFVRDELSKSRNALQFVKTQSLHDQKKREQEVNSLHLRLSKLTSSASDSSRIQILNSSSLSSTSASSPSSASSPTFSNTISRGVAVRRTPPPNSSPNESSALLAAELDLVKSSLTELESTRCHLDQENVELRSFLGELGDWVERLLEEERELYTSLSEAGGNEVDPDREEARKLLERLRIEEENSDQVYPPPSPHLSLPVASVLPRLHLKLYALRLTLLSSLRSVETRLSSARARNDEALEAEIDLRDQALERVEQIERALVDKDSELEHGRLLIEQFGLGVTRGNKLNEAKNAGDASGDDELPEEVVQSLEERKRLRLLKKAAATAPPNLASAEIEKPSNCSVAGRPSIPSQTVRDFLGSLGLNTPIATDGGGKTTLKSNRLVEGAAGARTRSRKSPSDDHVPRVGLGTTQNRVSSDEFASSRSCKDSNRGKDSGPIPTAAAASSTSRRSIAPTSIEPGPIPARSAALDSILSLALSPPPPPSSEPLTLFSSRAPPTRGNPLPSTTTSKAVLTSSRAVNGGGGGATAVRGTKLTTTTTTTTTTTADPGHEFKKSREQLVRDKKASLIAAQKAQAVTSNAKPVTKGAAESCGFEP